MSRQVIAYYVSDDTQPPGAMLADLARALAVSAGELLGLKPLAERQSAKTARLLKCLRKVADLPPANQRAVLKLVDALHHSNRPQERA